METNAVEILKALDLPVNCTNDRDDALYYEKWYNGYDSAFHDRRFEVMGKPETCTLRGSKLARLVTKEWASLLKFADSEIKIESEEFQTLVSDYFVEEDLLFKFVQFLEVVVGQGYGATLNFKADDEVKTRFLTPQDFHIIQIDGAKDVTGIAVTFIDFLYVEYKKDGEYNFSTYEVVSSDNARVEYSEKPSIKGTTKLPNFTIFQNAMSPNAYENALSPSIFVNAIDYIKSYEEVYNDFLEEYNLGRKRVIISKDLAKTEHFSDNANPVQYFDTNDRLYTVANFGAFDESSNPIKEINFDLRIADYLYGMHDLIQMVAFSSQLGSNYFSFTSDEGSINLTTATQVISNNSETYRHLKKFELNLENSLRKWLRNLIYLMTGEQIKLTDVKIKFDDSITKDDNTIKQQAIAEVQNGVRSVTSYLLDVLNLSESQAKSEMMRILTEQSLKSGVASKPETNSAQNEQDGAKTVDNQNQKLGDEQNETGTNSGDSKQ